jgi:hypothetical protein
MMMKTLVRAVLAAALILAPSTGALAGWKLVKRDVVVKVAKSTMSVTPGEDWNRSTFRASKKGETWTLDGTGVNEIYFAAALVPGDTLYRDMNKKVKPLPLLGKNIQLSDIPEFFESSQRVAYNSSLYEVTGVEPTKFLGQDGVRFTYQFAVEGIPLKYNGVAQAALVGGKLYIISFNAPMITFYERDRAKAEAIMASAKL